MTAADVVALAAESVGRVSDKPCPTCGWTPSMSARGGPVHIGIVLADVVHRARRCMKELLDTASPSDGTRR